MIIPIIYPSAAEFWLDGTLRKNIDYFNSKTIRYSELPNNYNISVRTEIFNAVSESAHLSKPLHIFVPTSDSRRILKSAKCHVQPDDLPKNSFIKVGSITLNSANNYKGLETISIFMASPEMCFLQAASVLSFPELIVFGNDLCARYIFDRNCKFFQRSRKILTTKKKIETFLHQINNSYNGLRKARRAIKYVLDNSNSPIESRLSVIASLPFSLGGNALGKPTLNKTVHLSTEAELYLGRDNLTGDMVWFEEKVIVEYDSNISHLEPDQAAYDKRRIAAFQQSEFKVINITNSDIKTLSDLDRVFALIRKELNQRNASTQLDKYYNKRNELFHILFKNTS